MEKEMKKQNVTLSLPREVLQKAKIIAIKKNTSLSGLLTQALNEIVAEEDQYALARSRQLACLERGIDLGTAGRTMWKREELHER